VPKISDAPPPTGTTGGLREVILAVGFLVLLGVGVVTVALPELSEAPEDPGAKGAGEATGEADAGAALPPSTP